MFASASKIFVLLSGVLLITGCPKSGTGSSDEESSGVAPEITSDQEKPYCSRDGQVDCIATALFPALAEPEDDPDIPNLSSDNIVQLLKSDAPFEFWDAYGQRYQSSGSSLFTANHLRQGVNIFGLTGTLTAEALVCQHSTQSSCETDSGCHWSGGSCAIDAWNLRVGKSLLGVSGQLKTSCRNRTSSPALTSLHDTVDDGNSGGAYPTGLVSGWSTDSDCGPEVWQDLTADGACDSVTDDCLMQDRITGLIYSESFPASGAASGTSAGHRHTWTAAVAHCNDLYYAGYSDWRLPTQKEMLEAYIHGIRYLGYKGSGTVRGSGTLDNNSDFLGDVDGRFGVYQYGFWTATSSSDVSHAIYIDLDGWVTAPYPKGWAVQFLCVRP